MKKNIFYFLTALLGLPVLQAQAQTALQKTPKGAQYQILTSNPGEKIKLNDVVTFQVIQKTDKDSVLFSSYAKGQPVKVQVVPSQNITDMMEIFPLLADKDSVLVKIPTDSVFTGHEEARPPFLPKGSFLNCWMKIERVQSLNDAIAERNAEAETMKQAEIASANNYIAANNLKPATTASGLKYIITSPSVKRKPVVGDSVFVNYVGRTIDGKVFDSSIQAVAAAANLNQPGRTYEPISFVVGKEEVIAGWDEALLLMHEGSKAKLIIPSSLAYGEKGAGDDIKPYSTLLFDVELVRVKPGKHPVAKAKPGAKKAPLKKAPVKKAVAKKPVAKKS